MKVDLTIEELYIILMNLKARSEWVKDNPEDISEIENECGHIANIIIKLREVERFVKNEDGEK